MSLLLPVSLALASLAALPVAPVAVPAPPARTVVTGRVLVKPAVVVKTDEDAAAWLGALSAASEIPLALEKRSLFGWLVVDAGVIGAGDVDTRAVARALTAQKGVLAAEPD
ncbi:MAG TPA: hypothetical protein VGO62_19690, partial [Myxococcota bacterium]